jgi:hypothetical protein
MQQHPAEQHTKLFAAGKGGEGSGEDG